MFYSSYFLFLAFSHISQQSYKNIMLSLFTFCMVMDRKKQKENHATKVTKIPKNQKTKNMG